MWPTDPLRPHRSAGIARSGRRRMRWVASVGLVVIGLVPTAACSGQSATDGSGAPSTPGGAGPVQTPTASATEEGSGPSDTATDDDQIETTPADAGSEALLRAAQEGDAESARSLLEAGTDPEDRALPTLPIVAAARNGHGSTVEALLTGGASPDPMGDGGPLSAAASTGGEDIVERLLEVGADADAVDRTGWSPLMWASYAGELASVRLLLEHGADRTVRATAGEFEGATALDVALAVGHDDVVRVLGG